MRSGIMPVSNPDHIGLVASTFLSTTKAAPLGMTDCVYAVLKRPAITTSARAVNRGTQKSCGSLATRW